MLAEVFRQVEKSSEPASGILPEEIAFLPGCPEKTEGPEGQMAR